MTAWVTVTQEDERRADVVILTAIKLEFDAVLKIEAGAVAGSSWEEATGPSGLPVVHRRFVGQGDRSLRVAVALAPDMGATAAVHTLLPLVAALRPRCVAMCGVCAGRRSKVALGDVVAADRLYYHDTGKQRPGRVEQDLTTYKLRDDWKIALELMDPVALFGNEAWFLARPLTTEWREQRTLVSLGNGDAEPWAGVDPAMTDGEWQELLAALKERKLVAVSGRALTAAGRRFVDELRFAQRGKLPDVSPAGPQHPLRLHVAPIGSGVRVIEDEQIWTFVSQAMRKTLGIEMEVAAIGELAHRQRQHTLDWVVMKGVMDFADHGRDDHFKEYAARMSAECLLWFLREHMVTEPATGFDDVRFDDAGDAKHAHASVRQPGDETLPAPPTSLVSSAVRSAPNGGTPRPHLTLDVQWNDGGNNGHKRRREVSRATSEEAIIEATFTMDWSQKRPSPTMILETVTWPVRSQVQPVWVRNNFVGIGTDSRTVAFRVKPNCLRTQKLIVTCKADEVECQEVRHLASAGGNALACISWVALVCFVVGWLSPFGTAVTVIGATAALCAACFGCLLPRMMSTFRAWAFARIWELTLPLVGILALLAALIPQYVLISIVNHSSISLPVSGTNLSPGERRTSLKFPRPELLPAIAQCVCPEDCACRDDDARWVEHLEILCRIPSADSACATTRVVDLRDLGLGRGTTGMLEVPLEWPNGFSDVRVKPSTVASDMIVTVRSGGQVVKITGYTARELSKLKLAAGQKLEIQFGKVGSLECKPSSFEEIDNISVAPPVVKIGITLGGVTSRWISEQPTELVRACLAPGENVVISLDHLVEGQRIRLPRALKIQNARIGDGPSFPCPDSEELRIVGFEGVPENVQRITIRGIVVARIGDRLGATCGPDDNAITDDGLTCSLSGTMLSCKKVLPSPPRSPSRSSFNPFEEPQCTLFNDGSIRSGCPCGVDITDKVSASKKNDVIERARALHIPCERVCRCE